MKLTLDTAPQIVRAIRDAKANGGQYSGDQLEPRPWVWPEDTWFQRRRLFLGLFPSVPKELREEMKHD